MNFDSVAATKDAITKADLAVAVALDAYDAAVAERVKVLDKAAEDVAAPRVGQGHAPSRARRRR